MRAVSVPCLERFLAQDARAREAVLPTGVRRVVVEAGVSLGLAQLLAPGDYFHGIDRFGTSAPYQELQKYFRLTTEDVLAEARKLLA